MTDLERYLMMQGMNKMALDFSKLMPWIRQTIEQQGLRQGGNTIPKWVVGVGAGVGGFGLANMLAQPRIDAARREGFGQATGQLSPLIQGMYGSQGAWRLPPYAQR